MSETPFDAAHETSFDDAQGTGEPARRRPAGRMVAVVVAVVAVVVAATVGATAVWSALGGGGPQPESVMPGSVVAFAKVDLNPSAQQKLAAFEFTRKFPQLHLDSSDSDLRHQLFVGLQRSGQLQGVDYARDIRPWIGSRLGVGVLPQKIGSGPQAQPALVFAVGVADADAARQHLATIARGMNGQCRLLQAYALCTDLPGDLASLVTEAQHHSLASSATYIHDMGQLGGDAIVAGWTDLDAARRVFPEAMTSTGQANPFLSMPGQKLSANPLLGMSGGGQSGRVAVAVRFVGSTVELAGQVNGATTTALGPSSGSGVERLPAGTLVAMGASDFGDAVRTAWPKLDQVLSGFPNAPRGGLTQVGRQVGLSLPNDLANALGSQLAIAFGGLDADRAPKIAVVTNGDHASVEKLTAGLHRLTGSSEPAVRSAGQRSVFAITDEYAAQVAGGSGLGQTAAFREAAPDAATARYVLYVDIAGLRRGFKGSIPAEQDKQIAPLSALGMTVSGTGSDMSFRLRLTTR